MKILETSWSAEIYCSVPNGCLYKLLITEEDLIIDFNFSSDDSYETPFVKIKCINCKETTYIKNIPKAIINKAYEDYLNNNKTCDKKFKGKLIEGY